MRSVPVDMPMSQAVREVVPVALSVAPFAVVVGATAARLGIGPLPGAGTAAGLFAGGAHYSALTLLASGTPVVSVFVTVALANARLMIYAAALEPRFRGQPWWFRWLGPALLIDQNYLLTTGRDEFDDAGAFRRYWLIVSLSPLAVWCGCVAVGGLLGSALPSWAPVDASAVVVMVGLLVPRLRSTPQVVVAGAALLVAVMAAALPSGLGVILAICSGLLAGSLAEGKVRR